MQAAHREAYEEAGVRGVSGAALAPRLVTAKKGAPNEIQMYVCHMRATRATRATRRCHPRRNVHSPSLTTIPLRYATGTCSM